MVKRRSALAAILAALTVMMAASCAMADSDKIGFIDTQAVLFAHPKYEQSQKHLDEFADKKYKEVMAAAEKETDQAKKREMIETARRESGEEEVRTMNPIQDQINAVIDKVAKSRGVTVVVSKTLIFFGGEDLTEEVVKQVRQIK